MVRIVPGISAGAIISAPATRRKPRNPVHDFNIRMRPFILQPCVVAPVLPGDTLKNVLVSYSAMTDPIKHPLIGWWYDMHGFFVPFRAMGIASELETMVLDPPSGKLNAPPDVAADVDMFHNHSGKPSFAYHALKSVVEEWFRNEGEDWLTNAHLDNMPQVGLKKRNALSSFVLDSASGEPDVLPGTADQDDNLDEILGSGLSAQFAGAYDAYQALVAAAVVDITFDDWLKQYGVRLPIPHTDPKPERLFSSSDWKFPSKAIDQTDGSIASAVHWRDDIKANDDKRFKEPGVVLVLACATPKVYLGNQLTAAADFLTRSLDWLPAVLAEHAFTSMKLFTSDGTGDAGVGDGPLGGNPSAGYWLDIRDLFMHGDQFINFATSATDASIVNLPGADGRSRFVSSTDADNLFSAASPANKVHVEGRCRLSFLSQVTDMTPNL